MARFPPINIGACGCAGLAIEGAPMTPRTPTESNGNLPWRMSAVERFADEQRELNAKINEGLWAIRSTMEKGFADLDTRVKVHDDRKNNVMKIWIGVVTALAVALIGFLLRISMIVQGAKLP